MATQIKSLNKNPINPINPINPYKPYKALNKNPERPLQGYHVVGSWSNWAAPQPMTKSLDGAHTLNVTLHGWASGFRV